MNIYTILGPLEVFREKLGIKEYFGKDLKLPDVSQADAKKTALINAVKQRANFRCEKCGKDLSKNKDALGIYNKSGIVSDMSMENLMAVCKECKALLGE